MAKTKGSTGGLTEAPDPTACELVFHFGSRVAADQYSHMWIHNWGCPVDVKFLQKAFRNIWIPIQASSSIEHRGLENSVLRNCKSLGSKYRGIPFDPLGLASPPRLGMKPIPARRLSSLPESYGHPNILMLGRVLNDSITE
ncbi:hypothetical protein E4U14_004607 [Claviceps sp. LM454 group G7]|nr:hypothetical protein E4U14_004607 [Claviceps sp. LM454 group G7]